MHIYFEFYVKVEKMLERKNSEYITAFSAKKIQISFYNHYSVYQTFFFLKYLPLIIYTLQEIKLFSTNVL